MLIDLIEGMLLAWAVECLPALTSERYRDPNWSLRSDWYPLQRAWSLRVSTRGWIDGLERRYL